MTVSLVFLCIVRRVGGERRRVVIGFERFGFISSMYDVEWFHMSASATELVAGFASAIVLFVVGGDCRHVRRVHRLCIVGGCMTWHVLTP